MSATLASLRVVFAFTMCFPCSFSLDPNSYPPDFSIIYFLTDLRCLLFILFTPRSIFTHQHRKTGENFLYVKTLFQYKLFTSTPAELYKANKYEIGYAQILNTVITTILHSTHVKHCLNTGQGDSFSLALKYGFK